MNAKDQDNLGGFLDALTEFSRRYKIGITGKPVLFVLENEDFDRVYSCDAESRLDYDQAQGSLTLSPELGPAGKPRAVSTPR